MEEAGRKLRFDPTINLGHVLTFAGFLITGAIGYFDLRERITINELRTAAIEAEASAEKSRIRETLRELREDMKEVRRGIDEIARRGAPKP